MRYTLCLHTLSPHFVSLRFVFALCPYTSSHHCRKRQGSWWRVILVLDPGTADTAVPAGTTGARWGKRLLARGSGDSRGCGPSVLSGAQRAASRDDFAPPVLARFCGNCPRCGA